VELDVHPALLRPAEGEVIVDRGDRTVRILADLDELAVTWFGYPPRENGPDLHVHHLHTDAFYVLEGELEIRVGPGGEHVVRASAGSFVAAPPDVAHTFRNASDAQAVFLNFHAPNTGFSDMLRARRDGRDEDAERFDQHDPPPDGGRPLDQAVVSLGDEGERFERENRVITIKGELPHLSALEIAFDSDFSVDPHRHDDHVDSFYVLDGEVEFTLEDEKVPAGPATWMSAPSGVLHGFRTPSRGRVLNVHAPETGFADSIRGR
jgi:quercetin dioxygenase-like cupin family protein